MAAAVAALLSAVLLLLGEALVMNQDPETPSFSADAGASVYTLRDGHKIPAIGFGCYRIPPGNSTYRSVLSALKTGYRMIDTAQLYMNEADVGRAIRDSGIRRKDIFVTTKIWDSEHGYSKALECGQKRNKALGLKYIDLLLIHSPLGGSIVETWDALLELKKQGVVRSVGVSNFGVQHLKQIKDYCRQMPVVNQFELHPLVFNERQPLVKYCQKHHILVQAYGSIMSGHEDLLHLAHKLAREHHKTDAQVMLRWALDQGFQVIPKSTHESRIIENFDLFDFKLSQEELTAMDSFKGALVGEYWNPLIIPTGAGNVGPVPQSCTP